MTTINFWREWQIPPNYGQEYTAGIEGIYFLHLAQQYNIVLIPFLLEDVAGNRSEFRQIGIHPHCRGTKDSSNNIGLIMCQGYLKK